MTNVETLTGSTSSDTVTLSALQLAGLGTVNLVSGFTDTLNVVANGDISQLALATMSNIDTGNLTGTSGTDSITLTGAQLNAILIGSGTINLGSGTGDTINLTSTSSDLNTLGAIELIDPGGGGDLRGDGRGWRHDHAVGPDRGLLDHRQRQRRHHHRRRGR